MKKRKLFNVHTHLSNLDSIPARVKDWESLGCVKCCALAEEPDENKEILKWMKEFPDFIIGMGSVEIRDAVGVPDDVDRLKEQGFTGLKFITPSHSYDDNRYMPLYERANQLKMPVIFHTGYGSYPAAADMLKTVSSENVRPWKLDKIARAFPNLQIIGAHLGLPHANEALSLMLKFSNIFYDMCGGSGKKTHLSLIKKAMAPFPGADMTNPEENLALQHFKKMMFSTDTAEISVWYPNSEEIMDYLQIPEETRELFYWSNAAKMFGVED